MNNSIFGKTMVLGARGMVGSAVIRAMDRRGMPRPMAVTHQMLDCLDQSAVREFLAREQPTCVIVAAAKVGGIEANRTHMAEFAYENLAVSVNVVDGAFRAGIQNLMFLGSSCIYPRMATQPIVESELLNGALEPTNEGYAIAKIAGMKLCQYYRKQYGVKYVSVMPTNLYGPGDSYDRKHSHVLPALIRRFEEAREQGVKKVSLWGTGSAMREFLHVDDMAEAVLHVMGLENPPDWANVGSGEEISIRNLAKMIRDATYPECEIEWDGIHPDGTPRKLLDCSLINSTGWSAKIGLREGIQRTIEDYHEEGRLGIRRDGAR